MVNSYKFIDGKLTTIKVKKADLPVFEEKQPNESENSEKFGKDAEQTGKMETFHKKSQNREKPKNEQKSENRKKWKKETQEEKDSRKADSVINDQIQDNIDKWEK